MQADYIDLIEEHARELVKAPPEWRVFCYEKVGESFGVIRVTGAVAPLFTSGKNAGKPNWRRRDKTTERIACFTRVEHYAWCDAWSKRTGKCAHCVGTGRLLAGWSTLDGVNWHQCGVCGGTGAAE